MRHFFLFALLLLVAPGPFAAAYPTIVETNELTFELNGDDIRVNGSYALENRGHEGAKEVFAAFAFGQWSYATPALALPAGQKKTWYVNDTFPAAMLACDPNGRDLCAGQQLPVRGVVPLKITCHFQDSDGFSFSSVSIQRVAVGELSAAERYRIQIPDIQAKLTLGADRDQTFEGVLELRNLADEALSISAALVTSRELDVVTPPRQLQVPPHGSMVIPAALSNYSGMSGSKYQVHAILQWQSGGIRHVTTASASAKLEPPKRSGLLIWMAAVVVGALLAYLFIRRRCSGQQQHR